MGLHDLVEAVQISSRPPTLGKEVIGVPRFFIRSTSALVNCSGRSDGTPCRPDMPGCPAIFMAPI